MTLDMTDRHLKIVLEILNNNLPIVATVWVFGSRAQKAKKKYSDLDLVIDFDGEKIPISTLICLNEAFDESDLPYKVDIVDWNTISPEFKKHIQNKRVLLLRPNPKL
ncbi:MAG: nucleotidyltransferase domain-containing protein [Legionellaceae bacterium]|nr:nucleotidyltransferase domain-containing protein [Legionellaceae bacterium]